MRLATLPLQLESSCVLRPGPVAGLSLTVALMIALSACQATQQDASTPVPAPEAEATTPHSIVVLGDSVAAGEGINYGYYYELESWDSYYDGWAGGIDDPIWQTPYQHCHDSAEAYGEVVAASLGADLAKFACTGATYENGLIGERIASGVVYRPAEFGDWTTQKGLNPEYDAAKPDLVILTFGADDVHFVELVTYCATGYTLDDAAEVEAIASADDPGERIRQNWRSRYPDFESLKKARNEKNSASASAYCTAANPGAPIETLFWKPINDGLIAQHYVDMVNAIQARGQRAGKVPEILFTTYHDPLPGPGESIECLDTGDLERDEIDYLISLQNTLDSTITNAVAQLPGVSVVDLSQVMDGHKWCTKDPWTYGLSALLLNDDSQAPFHPTPAGQQAIAALIEAAIP